MTRFVTKQDEFAATMESLGKVLRLAETFPAQVLNRVPAEFALFDPTLVFTGSFDEVLEGLFRVSDGVPVFFVSLAPDPIDYFFAHFGKYPLVCFDERVDGDGFRNPLNADPGGSPADAIIFRTERFAMFPRDLAWLLYADRDFELGIVAAFAEETASQVIRAFPADTLFDVERAVQDLLERFIVAACLPMSKKSCCVTILMQTDSTVEPTLEILFVESWDTSVWQYTNKQFKLVTAW